MVIRGTTFLAFADEACKRLASAFPDTGDVVARAERALGQVRWQSDADVAQWVVADPFHAAVALACLSDVPLSLAGRRIAEVLPELHGLSLVEDRVTYEHAAPDGSTRPTPLLDRALRALVVGVARSADLAPEDRALVTTVLLFADVAKGGSPEQRLGWRSRLGVDGTVHNEDSAVIFEDVFRRVLSKVVLSEDGQLLARARVLCQMSGLCGMRLRGEVPREVFGPLVEQAQSELDDGKRLGVVWSIVNHAETAAVRPGLWTAKLADAFAREERAILGSPTSQQLSRSVLVDRIARMRGGSLVGSDVLSAVERELERFLGARSVLESRLSHCQVWYAEPVLGAFSLPGAIRLLIYLCGASVSAGLDMHSPWHLDLLGMVRALREENGTVKRYPALLLETLLLRTPLELLIQGRMGTPDRVGDAHGIEALISIPSTKGGDRSLSVRFEPEGEAQALITLLSVYEKRPSAVFHTTLKALCDLYGLRKDDFDRVANEASYLATMNGSLRDKARLLDFVVDGTIVEVGPGGGALLELLASRFEASRVIGLDASRVVIDALRANPNHKYELIEGDAFRLPELFGEGELATVIFCSVLHEVFSYVPWGDPAKRFQLGCVDSLVSAAFRSLRVGGRMIVRDGVMPDDSAMVLEFTNPEWKQGFFLFAEGFEARTIPYERVGANRVQLSQRDAYEFLTTFTWGAASFPYEIREQRAVLPRQQYLERLLAACTSAHPRARAAEVAIPADLQSYLQPGYPEHILPHVRLLNAAGDQEIPLFDVTGVWVLERLA